MFSEEGEGVPPETTLESKKCASPSNTANLEMQAGEGSELNEVVEIQEEDDMQQQKFDKGKRPMQSLPSAVEKSVDSMDGRRKRQTMRGEQAQKPTQDNSDSDFQYVGQVLLSIWCSRKRQVHEDVSFRRH